MRRPHTTLTFLTVAIVIVVAFISVALLGPTAPHHLVGFVLFQDALLAAGLYILFSSALVRPWTPGEGLPVAAPSSADDDTTAPRPLPTGLSDQIRNRIATEVLRKTVPAVLVVLALASIAIRIGGPAHQSRIVTVLILFVALAAVWWLVRSGRVIAAAHTFIASIALTVLTGMIFNGGVQAPVFIAVIPVVAMIGWLYGPRPAALFSAAAVATGGLFVWMDHQGWLRHVPPPTPAMVWILISSLIIITFGVTALPNRLLRNALADSEARRWDLETTARDLADREAALYNAEEALRVEKTLTDAIFASMPGLLYVYDDQGRTVRWNGKAGQLLGLTEEQLASARLGDYVLAEDQPRAIAAAEKVMREGQATVEAMLLTGHGPATYFFTGVRVVIDGRPYLLGMGIDITERKRAEEALRREKALTDAIFASMPGLLYVYDDQGRLVLWNAKKREVTGQSDDELSRWHFGDGFAPEDHERAIALGRNVLLEGEGVLEANFLTTHGPVPYYFTGLRTILDGRPHLVGLAVDISERKQMEEAIRHEKALTDAIFDSLPGIIHLYDDHNRLIRWNARATQLSGFSDAELLNRPAGTGRSGEDRARLIDTLDRVLHDGRATVETTLVTKAGHQIPIFITGVRVTLNGRPHVLGIGIDITDRVRVEETLRREKAFTDAVFDNVPAVLSLYDADGRLVRWNRKSNEITGFSDADLANRHVGDAQPPEDRPRIAEAVRRTLDQGHTVAEAALLTKSGGRIPFFYTGVRVMIAGRPHILSIGVDISERKRAEEHLRRALDQAEAANRAKDHFLAAASHELRTPLTPVLLLTSALEADPHVPPDVRQDLGVIREHVEVEKRLIGDLLDFTAIHAGKLHMRPIPTDVHDVLRASARTCQEEMDRKGVRLDVSLDAERHQVVGDPDRLRQVFWNLFQNACKFSPEHSTVTIRTTDEDNGHTLRVEVGDTGRGMDEETLARLFRPFEQGPRDERMQHYGGLGLGLAISKTLVEAHGGSISATSPGPGRGSNFVIRLPLHAGAERSAAPDSSPNSQSATQPPPRLKLLLVEDHPLTLKTLARLLKADGHDVTTAMSVAEALRHAAAERFDLVLSDIGLPDGSGLDLMTTLRDRHAVPGIALSGFGADTDLEASTKAGFLAHVTKPVTLEALRDVLTRFATMPAARQ